MHALLRRRQITARLRSGLLLHRGDACIHGVGAVRKFVELFALDRRKLSNGGDCRTLRLFCGARGLLLCGLRRPLLYRWRRCNWLRRTISRRIFILRRR